MNARIPSLLGATAKIIASTACVVLLGVASATAQVITGSEFTASPSDAFTDPPHTMSNYGLTWGDYSSGGIGPSAMLSGYGGINFYSAAARRMTLDWHGNLGIGTSSPGARLEVNGNVKLTSGSGASITFADGTVQSTAYTGVSCGGDFAESVDTPPTTPKFQPGDVLVLTADGDGDVTESAQPYSSMVAGIYSTKPGYVGRRLTGPRRQDEVPLAMVGIVPTKVSAENGPIRRGDLLVTASLRGYAMKGTDRKRMLGAVVGKAMGSLDSGTSVIEVLVTLQ